MINSLLQAFFSFLLSVNFHLRIALYQI